MATSCQVHKIDSNISGLRFAEEVCIGQLPDPTPAVAATGTITLTINAVADDTVTVAGTVFTFVAASPTGNQVLVGANTAASATALRNAINALAAVNAGGTGSAITVTAATPGAAGNTIALAASVATVSGATLTGGVDPMGGATWYPLEPNSYSDFGAENTLTARNPINDSRQRQKGIITDREASGGFNQDLTNSNTQRLMQGFMFAKERVIGLVQDSGATATGYNVGGATTGFAPGQLVYASGFEPENNGLSVVTSITNGVAITDKTGMVAEAAKIGQTLTAVGVTVSASVVVTGAFPVLTGTALPVVPSGSYVFIGDTAANSYADSANNGFKRVRASSATQMQIDKSDAEMVAEGAKTVRIFFPRVLKNEQRALIERTSYHIERTLGSLDGLDPPQSEYLKGAVAGEWALNITAADKIAADFTFTAQDSEERTQAEGLYPGERPELVETNAYNSSDNVKRLRVALAGSPTEAPDPLVGFLTEWNMTINNNLSGNKAIGKAGSFEITAGTFAVSGQLEAYFASVEAVRAVRQNADVTLDAILVTPNTDVGMCGIVIDMPLVALGDARLNVELDQPIMLPLTAEAARGKKVSPLLDHTLLICFFDYLPVSAI